LRLAEEPISSLATTPVRGTPVRAAVEGGGEGEASSPPIRPASNGDEPGSQWWDALTLQMNLPDSPEKVAAPQPRPASRLVESRAHPAHLSSANPPFLALASISEPPPTSRLVTSLFHSSRPCAPDASARRPVTAGASALVPAHHLASSTASLNIGGSVKQPADAMLMPGDEAEAEAAMLQRDRELLAQEKLRFVRARERSRRTELLLNERDVALRAKEAVLAEEVAAFEKWRETESARLGREQSHVERQARVLLKLPTREERREVTQLRAELQAAAELGTQREQRTKLQLDRLRKQLASEVSLKNELEHEISILSSAAAASSAAASLQQPRGVANVRGQQPTALVASSRAFSGEGEDEEEEEEELERTAYTQHQQQLQENLHFDVRALIREQQSEGILKSDGQQLPSKRLVGGLFHSPTAAPILESGLNSTSSRTTGGHENSEKSTGVYNHFSYLHEQRPGGPYTAMGLGGKTLGSMYGDTRPALATRDANAHYEQQMPPLGHYEQQGRATLHANAYGYY